MFWRKLNNTQSTGVVGENLAANFLKNNKFRVLERNFKAPRWGEIDIIALDKDQLVFVEVKTRIGEQRVKPTEAIHYRKIHSLKRCAYFYITTHADIPHAYRLDAITVEFKNINDTNPKITHYKNIG